MNAATEQQKSELFVLLSSAAKPFRVVEIPRRKPDGSPIMAAFVPLSQKDMILASVEAERETQRLLKGSMPKAGDAQSGYNDAYNNFAAVQILYRAMKKHDDPTRPLFMSPSEVQDVFTNDEIGVMHHQYLTVKHELGPIVATMSDEEFEAVVTLLAEGGSATPLDFFSWGVLQTLVVRMAVQLRKSETDASSAGSQLEHTDSSEPEASNE